MYTYFFNLFDQFQSATFNAFSQGINKSDIGNDTGMLEKYVFRNLLKINVYFDEFNIKASKQMPNYAVSISFLIINLNHSLYFCYTSTSGIDNLQLLLSV